MMQRLLSLLLLVSLSAFGQVVTTGANAPGVSASSISGTIGVANGGSGRTTGTTAYALVATGTTATGAQQTLASGATTEVLVGGGSSALPVWTTAQGSGAPVRATSPTLTTPVIGSATGTSLLVTGIVDGQAPVTITTATSQSLGSTYKSGYTMNNTGTNGAAVTYTLPTAAAGLQYCVKNYTGKTGVLTVATSASGQFIDYVGVNTATGGNMTSAGALGDGACFIGTDATHWVMYNSLGTWTVH